jgi:hypothetical protein
MKLAAVVILVVACKGGDKPADKPSAEPAKPPSGGDVPTKASVKGELQITGAMTATVHWKDDLALTCTWIPGLKGGGIEVTMSDDKDTFIAFQEHFLDDRKDVILTSGKLKSASMLKGTSGFTMTGSDDASNLTATVDSDLDSKEGTKVHIKGTLEARCPH